MPHNCDRKWVCRLRLSSAKVETSIHDNIRELVTLECKEHGVKS